MKVKGDNAAISIFKFLADNITAINNIEIGLNLNGTYSFDSINDVFTSHTDSAIYGLENVLNHKSFSKGVRKHIHSHPHHSFLSVVDYDNMINVTNHETKYGKRLTSFLIYNTRTKNFREYKPGSKFIDFDHRIKTK